MFSKAASTSFRARRGRGKTILGNQICFALAAQDRHALYVTLLAESHARMIGHMRRLQFFEEAAIPDRMSYVGAFKILEEFIHELQTQAAFSNCTMFLLTSASDAEAFPPEHTMVDGLIELQSSLHGRRAERELQVHKLRGSWFMGGRHPYRIAASGISVFPRIEALLETPSVWDRADGPVVSFGISGVDAMLGGGIDTHSVTVVLGPSGSGKTSAGLQFLCGGPAGEPAMWFGFHENPMALKLKADALKLPLDARGDAISLLWRPQTEAILDEVATEMLTAIKARRVKRLVIDGIDGFSKLTDEKSRIGSFYPRCATSYGRLGLQHWGRPKPTMPE